MGSWSYHYPRLLIQSKWFNVHTCRSLGIMLYRVGSKEAKAVWTLAIPFVLLEVLIRLPLGSQPAKPGSLLRWGVVTHSTWALHFYFGRRFLFVYWETFLLPYRWFRYSLLRRSI